MSIGSGGSQSACHYVSYLYMMQGTIAKALTPMEVYDLSPIIHNSKLLFISASGRNSDILFGFDRAIEQEPDILACFCMKEDTPLSKMANKDNRAKVFQFSIPSKKDGFLATNSLIAYFVLLYRAFGYDNLSQLQLKDNDYIKCLDDFAHLISHRNSFTILYSSISQPVAIDIESKFTEAALGNALLTDYRNFGHGRHHWFAKQSESSAIVALITPNDRSLAMKTLDLLPKEIPVLMIESNEVSPLATIELLIKSFYLVSKIGETRGYDPGKPGVPEYGSKLYHLRYGSLLKKGDISTLAIRRKVGSQFFSSMSSSLKEKWKNSQRQFITKVNKAKFRAIIFDYDSTICPESNRFKGLPPQIVEKILMLLENGIIIGIATGRGKSVREVLQNSIPNRYWKDIFIGYYNAAQIGSLSDNIIPSVSPPFGENLVSFEQLLSEYNNDEIFKIEIRPLQVSISQIGRCSDYNMDYIRNVVNDILSKDQFCELKMVESSHSIDVIEKEKVSKLNLYSYIQSKISMSNDILCIGDKGLWPGNDYKLLSTPFSLSVSEVSTNQKECWNLASIGVKNTDATIEYLDKILIKEGYFVIKF